MKMIGSQVKSYRKNFGLNQKKIKFLNSDMFHLVKYV